MRILLLESGTLAPFFQEMGHSVLTILWKKGKPAAQHQLHVDCPLYYRDLLHIFASRNFEPDLVIWHDMGRIPRVWGLEALPCPTVGYFIDTFCNPWHVPYSAAFDCVWSAQKNTLPFFNQDKLPRKVFWKPLYYNPRTAFHTNQPRDIPVCFVGTLQSIQNNLRYDFLKQFQKLCPIVIKQGSYQPLFARSRIVLNQSVAGEINYRTFEAAACGAAVLNEDVDNGLLELFSPGVNTLPLYARYDAANAASIALEALRDEAGLSEIAQAGERIVTEQHSAPVRCRELLELYPLLADAPAVRKKLNAKIRGLLSLACSFIVGDAGSFMEPEVKRHFAMLEKAYVSRWDTLSSLKEAPL